MQKNISSSVVLVGIVIVVTFISVLVFYIFAKMYFVQSATSAPEVDDSVRVEVNLNGESDDVIAALPESDTNSLAQQLRDNEGKLTIFGARNIVLYSQIGSPITGVLARGYALRDASAELLKSNDSGLIDVYAPRAESAFSTGISYDESINRAHIRFASDDPNMALLTLYAVEYQSVVSGESLFVQEGYDYADDGTDPFKVLSENLYILDLGSRSMTEVSPFAENSIRNMGTYNAREGKMYFWKLDGNSISVKDLASGDEGIFIDDGDYVSGLLRSMHVSVSTEGIVIRSYDDAISRASFKWRKFDSSAQGNFWIDNDMVNNLDLFNSSFQSAFSDTEEGLIIFGSTREAFTVVKVGQDGSYSDSYIVQE